MLHVTGNLSHAKKMLCNSKLQPLQELATNHFKNITFTLVNFSREVNLIGWTENLSPLSKAKRKEGSSSSL